MSKVISIPELERRMRPGVYSVKGFLGQTESFAAIVAQDNRTLEILHISYSQIPDTLETMLQDGLGSVDISA